ncbi:phosphoribosyl-AMP cyclohydrolase [Thalassobaculum fulvum]|uniref:Phosphoribosyl-AMP cyclohydrolase n=1 Tax=Thalassobaculum fulvum TaxID=1633335 RepID=A0A918XTM0_9PROT|nr:phosphoribosyl-AMP cyclohydrolase [Thalassobaculum fulvum]GHD53208.1 phosphoribosyl-AMP cyclohydrolase [Thalassobaculum fulvum]
MTVEFAARGSHAEIEEGTALAPKFDADGLIPAIASDAGDGTVLMMAWMNAEALKATIETGEAHYWSRSRREMWRKGGTSGHVQKVREVRLDCDQDAVLLLVEQEGPGACHVGYRSCFFRRVAPDGAGGVRLETTGPKAYDPKAVYKTKP